MSLVLVTGGAGFVGANLAHRLIASGEDVRILDNLSRPGVEKNVSWLREQHGSRFELAVADVRDAAAVRAAVRGVDQVYHFAAQVAVTSSLVDPRHDFEVNARGTLNVLEAVREEPDPPGVIFTSTNKVYGALEDIRLSQGTTRYEPQDEVTRAHGISEDRPLSFHSPYGCSKGTADQYVLDWAHTYGMDVVVFRMSCIYGPRQFGNEDQGWVAHLLLRALHGETIAIYGDGRQVRDILYIDDLVDAFIRARTRIEAIGGRAFNLGGGAENTISPLELVDTIERLTKVRPRLSMEPWRRADHRYFVADTRAFSAATGWSARTPAREGLDRLYEWLCGIDEIFVPGRRGPRAHRAACDHLESARHG